jgi:hypothetical protein
MHVMPIDDDFSPTPPAPDRVAARALVLAAVCCRGLIEKDKLKSGTEKLRQNVVAWLSSLGVANELEPAESALLSTPLGQLSSKAVIDAGWQSEGMVVLAWSLHYAQLPSFHRQCEPSDVANEMGFLEERQNTPFQAPRLRAASEIEEWADIYLSLHWRLRQFSMHPGPMDFVTYVANCTWGPLRLDHLEIIDRDLAVDGVRIDKLEYPRFRQSLSISQERHQAFNWLLGFEPIYSQVTTDT